MTKPSRRRDPSRKSVVIPQFADFDLLCLLAPDLFLLSERQQPWAWRLDRSMRVLRSSLQISTRRVHTTGRGPAHRLTEPSSWVRPIAPAASFDGAETAKTLRDDFLLWPGFFSLEESRQLLAMALWKLDRVDSTRRRRRKGVTSVSGTRDGGGLQDLFHGEYGFEEVSQDAESDYPFYL